MRPIVSVPIEDNHAWDDDATELFRVFEFLELRFLLGVTCDEYIYHAQFAGSECDIPLLVTGLIRTQYCGICARAFCGGCTRNSLPLSSKGGGGGDAEGELLMPVCNFCKCNTHALVGNIVAVGSLSVGSLCFCMFMQLVLTVFNFKSKSVQSIVCASMGRPHGTSIMTS